MICVGHARKKSEKKLIKNVNQNDVYILKMAARTLFVYEILKYCSNFSDKIWIFLFTIFNPIVFIT